MVNLTVCPRTLDPAGQGRMLALPETYHCFPEPGSLSGKQHTRHAGTSRHAGREFSAQSRSTASDSDHEATAGS